MFVLDKSNFFPYFLWCRFDYAVPTRQNVGRPTKAAINVPAKKYFLSEDFSRAAELQVGSTICRVYWDEIRRGSNRCSVPRENHSRGLRKQRIPARFFAVLDAIGATCHVYKPGTRWCHKCCTTVDE